MSDLNTNFLWLSDDVPTFAKELSGMFTTLLEGVLCTLELDVNHRVVRGSLNLDGNVFEIRGFCSSVSRAVYGVLFEPINNTPAALLKITPKAWGLKLELDMPDFENIGRIYKPQAFTFQRKIIILIPISQSSDA